MEVSLMFDEIRTGETSSESRIRRTKRYAVFTSPVVLLPIRGRTADHECLLDDLFQG